MKRLALLLAIPLLLMAQSNQEPAKDQPVKEQPAKPDTSKPTPVKGNGYTTSDGLQYWDIVEGTGPQAVEGKRVRVHYTGWLQSGRKFDSSVDRGAPFVFVLGQGRVIRGWDEGVVGMKVGGKRQLRIPSLLGYGWRGAPPTIPPNATLIFDVELLGVEK